MALWMQVAAFVLVFDALVVGGLVYEYRAITKRRAFDWTSDPNWLAFTIAALVLSYALFG